MSSISGTKKVIILVAIIAAGIAGLLLVSPSAIAQLSNSTGTSNGSTAATSTPSIQITGTINLAQVITNQIKVSFSDAAKTAQNQISGGVVIGGNLGPMQGYLVYIFRVINPSTNTAYMVVVDPGNGSVLYTSPGHPIGQFMGYGFGAGHDMGMKMHRYHDQAWQSQQPSTTTPQSQFGAVPPAVLSNS